jgi:hypothetical protein
VKREQVSSKGVACDLRVKAKMAGPVVVNIYSF